MTIRITTLSENTASALDLLAEWGLSILVETETASVLLDAGQSISASHNARQMSIDLGKVNKIVLSHGHIDHTGGLQNVLAEMKTGVEVIAHPDALTAKYSGQREDRRRYIGIPRQSGQPGNSKAKFTLTREPVRLADNIMTTGEVPMVTDFEQIDPDRFFVREDAGWHPDELLDDQAIIIDNEPGLIVVLGCAHRGIINTLYHAQKLTGRREIQMVIGGCHLIWASVERVYRTIDALKALDVQKIGVSHCTGMEASAIMAQALADRFFFNNAGTQIKISGDRIDIN